MAVFGMQFTADEISTITNALENVRQTPEVQNLHARLLSFMEKANRNLGSKLNN
jgi:hypothetical protein